MVLPGGGSQRSSWSGCVHVEKTRSLDAESVRLMTKMRWLVEA
jgi:hypothetical protein